jgi:hypothetical protein
MKIEEFEKRAIRKAQRSLGIPDGWWGTREIVEGPGGVRVSWTRNGVWIIRVYGKIISKHNSRSFAIAKAKKL